MRAAAELDVVERRLPAVGEGLHVVQLQEPALGAPARRAHERALRGVTLPHFAPDAVGAENRLTAGSKPLHHGLSPQWQAIFSEKVGVTGQPSDGAGPVTTGSPVWLPVPPAG